MRDFVMSVVAIAVFTSQASAQSVAQPHEESVEQSLQPWKDRYPGARFVRVSPEEAQRLVDSGSARPLTASPPSEASPPPSAQTSRPSRCQRGGSQGSAALGVATLEGSPQSTHSFWSGDWWGRASDKDYLIVFAVVGVIVVAVLVVYSVAYLAEAAVCGSDVFSQWNAHVNVDSIVDQSSSQSRRGSLVGASVTPFWDVGFAKLGLNVEAGRLEASAAFTKSGRVVSVVSPYVTYGPRFLFGGDQFAVTLDALAGHAFSDGVGSLAAVRAGVQFGLGGGVNLGLRAGALLLGLKALESALPSDDLNYTFGATLGFAF